MKRICKKPDCETKKLDGSSLCYNHWRSREAEKKRERLERKKERKKQTKTYQKSELKKWKRKTWKLMSEWIRRGNADWRGYVRCFTCGVQMKWKEAHAGHHFHGKLNFDERNLAPQCKGCNTYRGGMLNIYAKKLIVQNGLEWYEKLEQAAAREEPLTLDQIKEIHEQLKSKLEKI